MSIRFAGRHFYFRVNNYPNNCLDCFTFVTVKAITRVVWILSLVSLFTDTASEMLYPVMPIYLKSIGFSMILIGVLEGMAEAIAGLSKGYFGKLSDSMQRRVPFVQLGYSLSAISKPIMVIFTYPLWIFFARTLDRVGKGIRTGARDALLSTEATPETKGRIFGFHRSMDTLGAVLGPAIALAYLYFYPERYQQLFYVALVPGLLAIGASLYLKENTLSVSVKKDRPTFFSFLKYWKQSSVPYRKLVVGLLAFALFNSSDVFLLLKAKQSGLSDSMVIGIYIFYNLIYALAAFPMGILADKVGLKKILIVGMGLFAIVYFGMGFTPPIYIYFVLFLLYGVYAAATEGISKALISNLSAPNETATAIGTYSAFQSISALFASTIAGILWTQAGMSATFIVTGIATVIVIVYFVVVVRD